MKLRTGVISLLVMLVAAAVLALGGCAAKQDTAKAAPDTFACAGKGKLVRATAPEAKLVGFSCFFKKWKGEKVLHFKVAVKNVSKEDQRFKVNIFMDNGKAVGGLLPRKIKKGLVKPGAVAKFTYPVRGMTKKPGSVTVLVKTMSK